MKIFVNARFLTQPVSGVQRYGIECSRQIKKIYQEVIFISPKAIINHDLATELNAIEIGAHTGHLWEQYDLPQYLKKMGNPPLVNLANTAPLRYSNNYLTLHDLAFFHHPEWNSRPFAMWYNFLIPRLLRNSKHIFTVSQTIKNEIVSHYRTNADKIAITYNGIAANMQPGYSTLKQKLILSVGSFNTRKNHQKLITAFLQSPLKNTYQLAIVGDKNKVFKAANVDERTLDANNIKIYQRLSDDELVTMYRNAEIVVSLSVYEGFGIPLLEGLYYGCKIVCSDIPVYNELFSGYACFCNPTNETSINEALEKSVSAVFHPATALLETYNYRESAKVIIDCILSDQQ